MKTPMARHPGRRRSAGRHNDDGQRRQLQLRQSAVRNSSSMSAMRTMSWTALALRGHGRCGRPEPERSESTGASSPGTPSIIDFGYYKEAGAIGNLVWEDTSQDGLLNGLESGLANIEVVLTITYPTGDVVTITTLTDGSGFTALKICCWMKTSTARAAASRPTASLLALQTPSLLTKAHQMPAALTAAPTTTPTTTAAKPPSRPGGRITPMTSGSTSAQRPSGCQTLSNALTAGVSAAGSSPGAAAAERAGRVSQAAGAADHMMRKANG